MSRSAALHAAEKGGTLITHSRRLARALKREFDAAQAAAGYEVWPTPDILPWNSWLERLYADASQRKPEPPLTALLTSPQEQALWERIIAESELGDELLQVPATATLCREAWRLAHEWRITDALSSFPPSDDTRVFLAWADRYRAQCARLKAIDGARLPALLNKLAEQQRLGLPQRIVACGFEELTPAQHEFLTRLHQLGTEVLLLAPSTKQARAVCVNFPASKDEVHAAAMWARARIEANPDARIGVIVPDLAASRSRIIRVFGEIMQPGAALPGVAGASRPFNVSLGLALTEYPLIATAFGILAFAAGEMELNELSGLIRSPYIAGAESEMGRRASFDARLREIGEPRFTVEWTRVLGSQTGGNGAAVFASEPIFAQQLSRLIDFRARGLSGQKPLSTWSRVFIDVLRLMGFPGERALSSEEFQTLVRWRELLSSLATLDAVTPRLDYPQALTRLRRLAADTLFQPETPDVPVQILGVLEAAGLTFDHLWVMGLTDEAWPASPRPNPFLPVPLQRRLGLPHASADQELAFARRLTAGWLDCAPEVVLSHPLREGDRELAASPLITTIESADFAQLGVPPLEPYREVIHRAARLTEIEDCQATPLSPGARVRGGTAVFRDQAACPFRAFAAHRLGAAGLQGPRPGLDPAERGMLLHQVLAKVWSQVRTRSTLDSLGEEALGKLIEDAAFSAVAGLKRRRPETLAGRFAELEQARLARLVREWLEVELERGEFEVVACEDKRTVALGGVVINAKLDRMDRLPDGRRLIIDYKTGKVQVKHWLGERPEEPQLPLYCVTAGDEVAAVAFGRVRLGEMKYYGLARDGDVLPGAKPFVELKEAAPYGTWDGLLTAWHKELTRLGEEFIAGHAPVDPKRYPHTCEFCELGPLCRINERLNLGPVENDASDDDE